MEIFEISQYLPEKLNYNISLFIMNGLHLPILAFISYLLGGDLLLTFFIFMKLVPYNYFNCFQCFVEDNEFYYFKHMIRLTDTGHIASMIFYFNRAFLPIAHNVHFVITFAYWFCRILFKLNEDYDQIGLEYKIIEIDQLYTILNHSSHYLIMCYYLYNNENSCNLFTQDTLYYSYMWVYTWLFAIYIPWVKLTNDYVYSVLEPKNHLIFKLFIVVFVNMLVLLSNNVIPTICMLK
tara:strand:- start:747 stop:1454 length:708 start_codon:yes stop_codon:yes gene_type:complete